MLQRKFQISSRVNISLFEALLVGYNPTEALFVLNGLHRGFPMGLIPNGPAPPAKLWASSFVSPSDRIVINAYLLAEIAARRIFGPFLHPPRGTFWANAVVTLCPLLLRKMGDLGLFRILAREVSFSASTDLFLNLNGLRRIPLSGKWLSLWDLLVSIRFISVSLTSKRRIGR